MEDKTIFVGIKKPEKPIKYFLALKADLSVYSAGPEVTIVTLQRSSLWKYLMEDYYKFLESGPGYHPLPRVNMTFVDRENISKCYGFYITGSSCLDTDDWPDCKGKIEGRGQWFITTKTKERKIIKKLFIRAKEEFRKDCSEGL